MMRGYTILMALCLASACSSTPRIESMSAEQRARMSAMEVFEGKPPRSFTVLGTVDGLACKRNAYMETEVARAEAFDEMKVKAALLGADAVVNVVCQKSSSADWRNNCWASDKCIGDAAKLK